MFDRLQQAESAGLSQEQMRKLEEQAAEQGMRTLWKVGAGLVLSLLASHFNRDRDRDRGSDRGSVCVCGTATIGIGPGAS